MVPYPELLRRTVSDRIASVKTIDRDNLAQYEIWQLVLWVGLNIQFQHAVVPLSAESQEGQNQLEEKYNALLHPLFDELERRGLTKDDVVHATLHALTLTPPPKS
jgi:hypothetical protein